MCQVLLVLRWLWTMLFHPFQNPFRRFDWSMTFVSLDNEVFEFKCSQGLLFDVSRQICDFKANVDNCDVTSGTRLIIFLTDWFSKFWLKKKYGRKWSNSYLLPTRKNLTADDSTSYPLEFYLSEEPSICPFSTMLLSEAFYRDATTETAAEERRLRWEAFGLRRWNLLPGYILLRR